MARIDKVGTRAGLEARPEPYWRSIRRGQALGYRAGAGTWIARAYHDGKNVYKALGSEVDLGYEDALEAAEEWWRSLAGGAPRHYDVLAAIEDYAVTKSEDATPRELATFWSDLRSLAKHITGELLGSEVSTLKTKDLESWRASLPVKAATKQRVYVVLAAALSNANRLHGVGDVKIWRRVRAVKIPKKKRSRMFMPTDQEVRDLIAACEPDFALIVRAAVLTACRYGELTALEVRDFDPEEGTLEVRGKTGERTMMLSSAAFAFFSERTKGKLPRARIFTTAEGGPWEKSMQHRRMRAATPIRPFVFYSLRHYAISQQLSAAVPAALVAKNCGTSEKMLREHYHHWIKSKDRELFDQVKVLA